MSKNYPPDVESKIKEIVEGFGLFRNLTEESTVMKVFNSPGVVLSELIVRYKKEDISEKEIISFLEKKLNISSEKAKKIKNRIEENIFSQMEKDNLYKEKGSDKYREPIE